MRRTLLIGFAVMVGLASLLPNVIIAQNDGDGSAASNKEYRGPLPPHFGKLGMSDAQKEKVYSLQEAYEEQIEKLRKQIEQVETKRDAEIATLLTPGQKLRLKELLDEAAQEAAAQSDSDRPTPPTAE
ncbi:MAG: hypothetical protein KDA93_06580 [Planctomycetaceae bacterium]|nr:hypothetical protein [Planctomycetaceae bacterium]